MKETFYSRTEMLIGKRALSLVKEAHVAIVGVGGVGSMAAESLARAGIGHLTLIDYDVIAPSNLNRQLHATRQTIGQSKVLAMQERLLSINPQLQITTVAAELNSASVGQLITADCNYVIDAIDMVSAKLALISYCDQTQLNIISSMGMGNKLDPTQLVITDIYQTQIDPLARVMRRELRRRAVVSLDVIYSKEPPVKPFMKTQTEAAPDAAMKRPPASAAFVPNSAGLIAGGYVLRKLIAHRVDS